MSWATITDEDVTSRMMMSEVEAARLQHSMDPLSSIITGVANEIRGRILGAGFTLGSGTSIPDELLDTACIIIRHRLLASLPGEDLITQARKDEAERADRLLELLADGKFKISAPDTATSDEPDDDAVIYGSATILEL